MATARSARIHYLHGRFARKQVELAEFAELYRNPAINAAITFLEPLPVGLIFALVSAGVLSRRRNAAATMAGARVST